jgi:hypothetical protein
MAVGELDKPSLELNMLLDTGSNGSGRVSMENIAPLVHPHRIKKGKNGHKVISLGVELAHQLHREA